MSGAPSPGARLRRLARGSVAGLWSYWTLPPALSRRLVVALVVWPALLFSFFLLPEAGYRNVTPLFAAVTPPSAKADQSTPLPPNEAAGIPQIRQLAVLALPMEGQIGQEDFAQSNRVRLLRQRVGTNILVSAGYLSDAYLVTQGQDPPISNYVLTPDGGAIGCAVPDVPAAEDTDIDRATRVALAIVAIEKFNRNTVHRLAERTYAKLYRWAFGPLPDLSFGPAQIRLSTLRQIAAERPGWPKAAAWASMSDDQLLDALWHECDALNIVAIFAVHQFARLRQLPGKDYVSVADVAAAYAGQRRRSAAPIDYAGIVEEMVSMMEATLPDKPAPPPSDLPAPRDAAPVGGKPADQ